MISKYIFRFSGQAEFSTPRQTFHGSQCSVFGLTHRPVSDSVKRNISSRTEVKKKYLQKYFASTKMWRRTVKRNLISRKGSVPGFGMTTTQNPRTSLRITHQRKPPYDQPYATVTSLRYPQTNLTHYQKARSLTPLKGHTGLYQNHHKKETNLEPRAQTRQ